MKLFDSVYVVPIKYGKSKASFLVYTFYYQKIKIAIQERKKNGVYGDDILTERQCVHSDNFDVESASHTVRSVKTDECNIKAFID